MNRSSLLLLLALVVGTVGFVVNTKGQPSPSTELPVVCAVDQGVPGVRTVGLMVNGPILDNQAGSSFENLAFFGTFAKTRMALELAYPDGGLIALVDDDCEVTSFGDDTGSDLLSQESMFSTLEMMSRVSEDTRSLVFVLASDRLPASGATRLDASGEVTVMVAREQATWHAESVSLTEGTEFQVGPYHFRVDESGPSEWGEGWALTLYTEDDPSPVVRYALVDENGDETELSESMTMMGNGTWTKTLVADQPFERATFLVESWKDARKEKIPFRASAGLGLR